MRKSTIVLISVLLLIVVVGLTSPISAVSRKPVVARIIDGDTLVMSDKKHVRLAGINAPERKACGYVDATAALTKLAPIGSTVALVKPSKAKDKYGRELAVVFNGSTNVNYELVLNGYVHTFMLRGVGNLSTSFLAAESVARNAGRGLWGKCEW